jgi:hypothetical protein
MSIINDGGGIANYGKLTITNSTLSGNTTTPQDIASSTAFNSSGGIVNYGGHADIAFCTVYNNSNRVQGSGGGIFTRDGEDDQGNKKPGSLRIRDSIVAGNHASSHPDIAGTLTTGGYNLFQDTSGATFNDPDNKHSTDLVGVKLPNLGIDPQLKANGGLTQTLALLAGSPAIDAIPPADCVAVTTDQRGVKRPQGRGCDIGAYEYKAP